MKSEFTSMSENELMDVDGGFLIFGVAVSGAMLLKAGACLVIAGGVGMFAKGCYDGINGY